jgi:NDP-sugar pyrophosphorylase family protein
MLKIVVPMGGEGRRFIEQGYTFPKPLIEIDGRPMIELVAENLTPKGPHEFIFICRQEHLDQYALADVLRLVAPGCRVVSMREATAGALCSVLLASNHLGGDEELLVANADQIVDVSIDSFLADSRNCSADGSIVTFPSTHPKWSYVKLEGELVVAAAEKRPISLHATAGLYYFRRASQFIAAAERMLLKNASLRSEFFVCPVYNEFVLAGLRVTTFAIDRHAMHSLGTPEDVKRYATVLEGPLTGPPALDTRP